MRYCIVITRRGGRAPIVLGPFRDEKRATRKADAIANALHGTGLYLAVEVQPLYIGTTTASEAARLAR